MAWAFLARPPRDAQRMEPARAERLADGPWGHVEITSVVLEPPLDKLVVGDCEGDRAEWRFHGRSRAQVEALLADAGVDEKWRAQLMSIATCNAAGCIVVPDDDTVLGLQPEHRRALYATLAPFADNVEQHWALSLPIDRRDLWLGDAALGPEVTEMIRKLMWREGDVLHFGDMRLLCRLAPRARRPRMFQVLGRHPAENLVLDVPHDADVTALAAWWERGSGAGSLRPLLEALARLPDGGRVDVGELLPRVARARLNRFPEPDEVGRDCHWTALNFHNRRSDDRYLDGAEITRALEHDFDPVRREQVALGDLLVITEAGKTVHSAVYIAADVVYTKNGRSASVPWQLMRMRDLMVLYPGDAHFLRRRGPPPPLATKR